VKPVVLVVVALSVSCTYPDIGFRADDSAAPLDTFTDTYVEDTFDANEVEDTRDAAPPPVPTYASCAALLAAEPSATSGVYSLDPDGAGPIAPFTTFCEMTEDGGGWTLALKLDGAKKTFVYDSPLWTNSDTLNPSESLLDNVEAKLASFSTMPFTSLRVGMLSGGVRRWIRISVAGASLRAVFAGGPVNTKLGRAEWAKLLADPRLQANCDAEGLNRDFTTVTPYSARARLGVFGNNEADCDSPDSYLGFGAGFVMPHMCVGTDPGIVVGNFNPYCGIPTGEGRSITAFGYILLR
jgi:hypothetical protein